MKLTVTKIEPGGISHVNRVTPCVVCNRYTDHTTSPLVDLCLWLDSPRGATTYGARIPIHADCLAKFIPGEKHDVHPALICDQPDKLNPAFPCRKRRPCPDHDRGGAA